MPPSVNDRLKINIRLQLSKIKKSNICYDCKNKLFNCKFKQYLKKHENKLMYWLDEK